MKIWIPTIGERLRLLEPWTFELVNDHRNIDLLRARDICGPGAPRAMSAFTLSAETVLKVDRIYIRGSFRNCDSVTFRVHQSPQERRLTSKRYGGNGPVSCRFFAKLRDVNKIEAEYVI